MGSCVSTAADVQAGYLIPINRRKVGAVPTKETSFPVTQRKVQSASKSYRVPPTKKATGGDLHNDDDDTFDQTPSSSTDYQSDDSDYVFDSVSSCSDNIRLRCMLFNASVPNVLLPTHDSNQCGGGGGQNPSPAGSTFVGTHGEMSLLPLYRQQNSTTFLHNPSTTYHFTHQQFASTTSDEGGGGDSGENSKRDKRGSYNNNNTPPAAAATSPGNGGGEALTPPSDPFLFNLHQNVVPMLLSGDARLANMIGSRFGAGYCNTLQALRFVKSKNGGPCYNTNTGSLIVSSSSLGGKKRRSRNSTRGGGQPANTPSDGGGGGSHVKRIQALATSISKGRNGNNSAVAYFSFTRDMMCYGGLDKEGLLYPGWKEVELRRRRQYFRHRAKKAARERQSKTGATPRKKKSPKTPAPNNTQSEISSVLSGRSRNSRKVVASDFSSSSAEDATDENIFSDQGGSPLGNTIASTKKNNNGTTPKNVTTSATVPRPPLRAPVHPRCRFLKYVDVLDSPFIEYGVCRGEMRKYILNNDYVPPCPTSTDAISSFGIDISAPDLACAIASCGDEGQLTISGSAYPAGLLGGGGSGGCPAPEDLLTNFRILHDEDHFEYDLAEENAPKVTTGGAAVSSQAHRLDSVSSGVGRGGTSPSSSANLPSRQQTMQVPRVSGLSPAASPLGLDAPARSPRGDSCSQLSDDARDIVNRARSSNNKRRNSGGSLSSAFEGGNLNVRNVLSSEGSNSTLHHAPAQNPIQRAAARRHRKERMYVTFGETCKYEVDDLRQPGMKSQEQQLGGLAGGAAQSSPLTQRAMAARGATLTPSSPILHHHQHNDSDPDGASLEDEAGSRSNTDDGAPAEEAPCSWAISRKFKVLKTFVQHGINSDPDQFTKSLEEDSVLMHRRDVVRIAMWIDDILQLALLNHLSQIATKSCPDPLEDFYGTDNVEDAASEEIPRPGTRAPASPTTASGRQRQTRSNSVGWVGDNASDHTTAPPTTSLIELSKVNNNGGAAATNTTPTSAFVQGVSCHPVIRAVTFAAGMRGRRRVRRHIRVLRLHCSTQPTPNINTNTSKKDNSSNHTAPLMIDGIPRISGNSDLIRKTGGLELDSMKGGGDGGRTSLEGTHLDPSSSNSPITSSSPNPRGINAQSSAAGGGPKTTGGSSFASSRKSNTMMDSYGETQSSNFRGGKGGGAGSGNPVNTDVTSDSTHNTNTGGRAEALEIDVAVVPPPPRLSFPSNAKKSGFTGEYVGGDTTTKSNNPLQQNSGGLSSIIPVSSVKNCVEIMSIRPPKKTIRRLFDVRLRCAPDISAHVDIKALFRAVNNFATSVHFSTTVASAAQQQQGGGASSMAMAGGGSFHIVPSKNAPQPGFLGTPMSPNHNLNNTTTVSDAQGGSFNASGSDMLTFALAKSSPSLLTADGSHNKPLPPTFNTTNGLLTAGNSGQNNKQSAASPTASPTGGGISSSSQRSQDAVSKNSNTTAPTSLVLPPGLLHNGGVVVSSPFVSLLPPIIFELLQLCLVANNPMRDVGTTSYMSNDTNIPLVSLLTSVSKGITHLGDAAIISSALKTIDFPLGEFVVDDSSRVNSDEDDDAERINDNATDHMTIASSPTSNYHGGLQSATSSMSQVPIRGMPDPNSHHHIHHLTDAQRSHQIVLQGILARLQIAASSAASATSVSGVAGRVGASQQQQHSYSTATGHINTSSTAGAPVTVLHKPVVVTEGDTFPVSAAGSRTGSPKMSPKDDNKRSSFSTEAAQQTGIQNNNAPLTTLLPGSTSADSPMKYLEGGGGAGDTLQISIPDTAGAVGTDGASWSMADGQHQSTTLVSPDLVQHIRPTLSNNNINNSTNNRGHAIRSVGAGDLVDESLVSPHTHQLQSSTASGIIHLQVPISSPLGHLAGNSTSSGNNHSRSQNTPGSLKSQAAPNPPSDPAALFAWKERTMTADALKAYIKYQQFLAKQRKKEDSMFERRLLATPPSIRQLVFGPVPYSRAVVRPGLLSPNQLAMQQHQQQLLASLTGSFTNLPAASQAAAERQHCFYDTLTHDEGSDEDGS